MRPWPKLHVSTTINGEPIEFLCEPGDTLLDVLRGPLGLTGTKEGCALRRLRRLQRSRSTAAWSAPA